MTSTSYMPLLSLGLVGSLVVGIDEEVEAKLQNKFATSTKTEFNINKEHMEHDKNNRRK
jgi:hypothetical protein